MNDQNYIDVAEIDRIKTEISRNEREIAAIEARLAGDRNAGPSIFSKPEDNPRNNATISNGNGETHNVHLDYVAELERKEKEVDKDLAKTDANINNYIKSISDDEKRIAEYQEAIDSLGKENEELGARMRDVPEGPEGDLEVSEIGAQIQRNREEISDINSKLIPELETRIENYRSNIVRERQNRANIEKRKNFYAEQQIKYTRAENQRDMERLTQLHNRVEVLKEVSERIESPVQQSTPVQQLTPVQPTQEIRHIDPNDLTNTWGVTTGEPLPPIVGVDISNQEPKQPIVPPSNIEKTNSINDGNHPKQDLDGEVNPLPAGLEQDPTPVVSIQKIEDIDPISISTQDQTVEKIDSKVENKEEALVFDEIIAKLEKDLDIDPRTKNIYANSQLEVTSEFKRARESGQLVYDAPAMVKTFFTCILGIPVKGIKKVIAKCQYTPEMQEIVEEIRKRAADLSEKEIEIAERDFGRLVTLTSDTPIIVSYLLKEEINHRKMVEAQELNFDIAVAYEQVFADYKRICEIEDQLDGPGLSVEEKQTLQSEKDSLLAGKGQQIASIREKYTKAEKLLNGGEGIHGMDEMQRAVESGMNVTGRRFGKRTDGSDEYKELTEKMAALEKAEQEGILNNDDMKALSSFIAREQELCANSEVRHTLLRGDISVGKRQYTPLATSYDYRDDPLVKDVIGAVVGVATVVSIANSIATEIAAQAKNASDTAINAINDQKGVFVREKGEQLYGESESIGRGIESHSFEGVQGKYTGGEIAQSMRHSVGGGVSNSGFGVSRGQTYQQEDALLHIESTSAYKSVEDGIKQASVHRQTGAINEVEYLKELQTVSDIARVAQEQSIDAIKGILQQYRTINPSFDHTSLEGTLSQLERLSGAEAGLESAAIQSVEIGELLKTFQPAFVSVGAPTDTITTIIAGVMGNYLAGQALKAGKEAEKRRAHKNEITDLVEKSLKENGRTR